jgi:hypothetical protein
LRQVLVRVSSATHPHLNPPLEGEETVSTSPPSRGRRRGGWVNMSAA